MTGCDGDGVGDNWDNYPNDSSLQSLTLQEALDRVNDPNLRNCISKGQQGASRAQEVVEVFCQVEVDDLGGIQNFYNLKNLYLCCLTTGSGPVFQRERPPRPKP